MLDDRLGHRLMLRDPCLLGHRGRPQDRWWRVATRARQGRFTRQDRASCV
jgi:hypothetical protein